MNSAAVEQITITPLALPGVLLLRPLTHRDSRGAFTETWRASTYRALGLPDFVQDNLVHSKACVLRGMHYQTRKPQGKLICVLQGAVQDIVADINPRSAHFGQHVSVQLDAQAGDQLYVPPGYAHGYYTQSNSAMVLYKCTDYYDPEGQGGCRWDDPLLALPWQLKGAPTVAPRDEKWPPLAAQ
ncbi:dTDP-4-dehydrorhamnose 3,5-epimerase [Simiduia sp. 21SJ11W-1]|uniref:dTDP-4-dehydrorhamnose 3,5-epimerase n=1 Tax=Simiduia sp. 21SJ11W-1 TaxID=2909669 RepID=UPI0020A030D3|nr:dTDP-4-dehydrorhamnose 3,5-epimerase [Simiduia sp. 21SJ11W-1]UTA48139.1 dTDP-4-dehydrorhamnose 3,5-epimerase [Simiduia sp. 21SJ11W-1]